MTVLKFLQIRWYNICHDSYTQAIEGYSKCFITHTCIFVNYLSKLQLIYKNNTEILRKHVLITTLLHVWAFKTEETRPTQYYYLIATSLFLNVDFPL